MSDQVTCSKCGSAVESGTGFGMVTCLSCGEIILLGTTDGPGMAPISPSAADPVPFQEPSMRPMRPEMATSIINNAESLNFTPSATNAGQEMIQSEPVSSSDSAMPPAPEPFAEMKADGKASFGDVADFGNQELPSTAHGALVYDIRISGIDTAEVREDFADCLRDKKLGLDIQELISQIKNGELTLKQLNPVKASVILSRVKHLPIRVTWISHQLVRGMQILAFLVFSFSVSSYGVDWGRHEVNLKGYASKINSAQEEIAKLIAQKNANRDPAVRDELLKEIIKKNKELKTIYKDFKAEKEHVRFEHPEQDDKTERKYRKVKLKSLDELENEAGVDGQLSRLKNKIGDTYPMPEPTPSVVPHKK